MIDIVFPLGNGSPHDNWELRTTLRSIEKKMTGVGRVFCVGNYPSWASPELIHIKWEQSGGKAFRIFYKFLLATSQCSEQFIGWSDDTPLLINMSAADLPVYCNKTLDHWGSMSLSREYLKIVRSTRDRFPGGVFYNVHTPALYDREKYKTLYDLLDWDKAQYLVKSSYFNIYPPTERVEIPDPKMKPDGLPDLPFVSFHSRVHPATMKMFDELFPNKSRWEI